MGLIRGKGGCYRCFFTELLQFWKGTFGVIGEVSVVLSLIYRNRNVARAIGLEKTPNKTGFCDQMQIQRLIF